MVNKPTKTHKMTNENCMVCQVVFFCQWCLESVLTILLNHVLAAVRKCILSSLALKVSKGAFSSYKKPYLVQTRFRIGGLPELG